MPLRRVKSIENVPIEGAFERFYPAVFRYFHFRGADIQTANDLASSTFERALENLSRYDPARAQIQTWLFSIARNLAINHWKAETNHPTVSLEELEATALSGPLPEDILIQTQNRQDISAALQSLDSRAVDILALKFGGRLTNREIAELVQLSTTNVGVILYRSLIKLHQALTSDQPEVFDEPR